VIAARHTIYFTRHEAGLLRCQQRVNRREFRWLSGTLHRRIGAEFFDFLLRLTTARPQRYSHRTRCDRIHAYALADDLFHFYLQFTCSLLSLSAVAL
jgi:hypothetical protein